MNWIQTHRQSALIVAGTLILPLVLLLYGVGSLWGQRFEAQRQIDRLEPRLARMLGVLEYEDQLGEAYSAVDTQVLDLAYPLQQKRAAVSADLQKNVLGLVRQAGLGVTNSQVLPPRERDGFDYIGLKFTVSGELEALNSALEALSGYMPVLLVESIDVWPARAPRGKAATERKLTATIQLLSLRVAE